MTTDMATSHAYTLGTNPAERARLQGQADDLAASHGRRCSTTPICPWAAGRSSWAAARPGRSRFWPNGWAPQDSVTAIDIDPAHVALARQFVADRGLDHVEVLQGDARATALPSGVVRSGARPAAAGQHSSAGTGDGRNGSPGQAGGMGRHDEADGGARVCYPPLEAWDQLAAIFHAAYRSEGADLLIGRKLTALLRDAGLVDVGADARADVYPAGHPRRTILPDLVRSMRDKVIERGIVSEDELAASTGQVRNTWPTRRP